MQFRAAFTPMMAMIGVCFASLTVWQLWPEAPAAADAPAAAGERQLLADAAAPIRPIPPATGLDSGKVALGRRLFQDPRLSRNGTVSCASCHNLATAGIDGRAHSVGIDGHQGARNAPTVFNACLNYRQFWDGRAATLEEQMDGPLRASAEMGSDWVLVTRKLTADPQYVRAFADLYPDGIQPQTIKDAIATFERSLVTPDAPFDRYLGGDRDAISPLAGHGYRLFVSDGCASCHQGLNVGGNMMQPFGVMLDPVAVRAAALHSDSRLIRLTDIEAGTGGERFKVPSLRNVARTAPYFHDGSEKSLTGAIRIMGISQLGHRLPDGDVAAIRAFLETLTGRYEGRSL